MIVVVCGLLPVVSAMLLLIPGMRGRTASILLVTTALIELVLVFGQATRRMAGSKQYYLNNYFVLDASSLLFLLLITIIFLGVTLYIHYRISVGIMHEAFDGFVARVLLFFASSVLAVLSNHLVAMWAFLELGTLAIASLIFYARGKEAFFASWKYLLFSVVGLGFNLLGLLCLARAMSGEDGIHEESLTLFISGLQQAKTLGDKLWWEVGLAFMVFGLGTKLGLVPMYSWLPDAYDQAPPSITTLLASVQFNCVTLCLFREVGLLRSFDPTLVSDELLVMGILSIIIAALHIIAVDNYKRLIAYASINHAGTIAMGLGIGKTAAFGVVLYVVSNAFVKAILFLTCGNIKAHFGTKQMSALRGIIRVMPFSGWTFMLGVFALLGFAPFGSFIGEVMILSSMVEGVYIYLLFLICILLIIVLIACGRSLFPMIWGESQDESPRHAEPFQSNAPSILFIAILVSLGIYSPISVTSLIREVALTLGTR